MTSYAQDQALSEAQFDRLQSFLGSRHSGKAMSLEKLDGFFAALIVGPDMVMPSEYMPLILGREMSDEDAFADEQEAEEILSLLMHHWNAIAGALESDGLYLPLFLQDDQGVAGCDWAQGFMQGVHLRRESWSELIADEQEAGAILPIALMAGEVDPEWPEKLQGNQMREEMPTLLAAGLVRIHRYFAPHRRGLARGESDKRTYRRSGSKVGRNEPCPCGSGRKYKHCCGIAARPIFH